MAGLYQNFEAALQNLKTELIMELNRTNVLKKANIESLLLSFNQKLINIQTQFLAKVASEKSSVKIEFTEPHAKNFKDLGKIVLSGVGTGGLATAVLTFVTISVPTKGLWAAILGWITGGGTATMTLAAYLAGLWGVSTTLVFGLLSGGLGFLALAGSYMLFLPVWKKRIRKKLLDEFDNDILPELRKWAKEVINKTNMN